MGWFRDGYRFSRLAAAMALLALAGFLVAPFGPVVAGAAALAGLGCLAAALIRRTDPYDLKRLWDEPPAGEGDLLEPEADFLGAEETGGPYCAYCDEPHPGGAVRCRCCGRVFA